MNWFIILDVLTCSQAKQLRGGMLLHKYETGICIFTIYVENYFLWKKKHTVYFYESTNLSRKRVLSLTIYI